VPEHCTYEILIAIMKSSLLLPLCAAALAAAIHDPHDAQMVLQDPQPSIVERDEYLVELAPGETRWITEDEKWKLRRVRRLDYVSSLPLIVR
jgi:hypothetical protein